jgi:hypothetical protein
MQLSIEFLFLLYVKRSMLKRLPFLFIGDNAGDLKTLAVRPLTRKATLSWQKSQRITSQRVFAERMLYEAVTGFFSRSRIESVFPLQHRRDQRQPDSHPQHLRGQNRRPPQRLQSRKLQRWQGGHSHAATQSQKPPR